MYKDKQIAEIKDTEFVKSFDDNLLPVIMINKNAGALEAWLQTRVIDTHRTNARRAIKCKCSSTGCFVVCDKD